MTSTPVKSAGLGLSGLMSSGAGTRVSADGGFQAVWNNQAGKQADNAEQPKDSQTVKKTPGDSLKARDEHRVRTEKREPSRDVEERTDIPEEKLEEAAEILGAAAVQIIEDVAEAFGVEPAEVQEILTELGLEQTDVLTTEGLGRLILAVAGEKSPQALLTNEELYGKYQELMGRLTDTLRECSEILEVSPEQLTDMVQQPEETVEAAEPVTIEVVREFEKPEENTDIVPDAGRETVKPAEEKGRAFILRLYEAEGAADKTTLTFGFPVKSLAQTNMLEEVLEEYPKAQQIELSFRAFEIKTLRVEY